MVCVLAFPLMICMTDHFPLAKSFTSDTATLYDSQDVKSKESKSAMNTALESSTGFSQKAKEEGWGSPTATRPTFNG
ncbi:hypothetical protein C8Q76DRAFT_249396 [Earliella scabrosa]|nr:hypothetical protein C8Q76DRAFT_249396 [Earliella scabrosa]